jgi:hypothetical protein
VEDARDGRTEEGKEGKRERGKEGKRERGKAGKRESGKEGRTEELVIPSGARDLARSRPNSGGAGPSLRAG